MKNVKYSITDIKIINNEKKQIREKVKELTDKRKILDSNKQEIAESVIKSMLEDFITELKTDAYNYTENNKSYDFTKYVNHTNIFTSEEHEKAIYDFNEAKIKLMKVFANDLVDDINHCQERIARYASLKNINK